MRGERARPSACTARHGVGSHAVPPTTECASRWSLRLRPARVDGVGQTLVVAESKPTRAASPLRRPPAAGDFRARLAPRSAAPRAAQCLEVVHGTEEKERPQDDPHNPRQRRPSGEDHHDRPRGANQENYANKNRGGLDFLDSACRLGRVIITVLGHHPPTNTHAHSADAVPSDARRSSTTTSEALRASCIIVRPPEGKRCQRSGRVQSRRSGKIRR
jgi:hypothetical protein